MLMAWSIDGVHSAHEMKLNSIQLKTIVVILIALLLRSNDYN